MLLCSCGFTTNDDRQVECNVKKNKIVKVSHLTSAKEYAQKRHDVYMDYINEEIAQYYPMASGIANVEMGYLRRGYGVLLIPSVDICVKLIYTQDCYDRQDICDRWDTAVIYDNYYKHPIIADHNIQAFETLQDVEIGDNAYIIFADSYDMYRCVNIIDGHNTEYDCTDENYDSSIEYQYDLMCYTCINGWMNIRIVAFEKCK